MRKITTLIISALCSVVGFAQTDIATARSQGIGASVTITGIVTNGSELGDPNLRYIEDNTGGMALYSSSVSGFQRGDEVTVSGTLKDYYGLLEMDPVNSNTTNTTGKAFTPQVLTPIQINEATESELVQINNVIFNNGGSFFTGNTAFDFMANGDPGKIYIKNGSPLIGTLIPMGTVTLIGIASQHTYNFGCPHTSVVCPASDGYQILPRDSADLIQSGSIIFTSSVSQTNITTSSFDLSWSVSANSSANCNPSLTISPLTPMMVSNFFSPFGRFSSGLTNTPNVFGINSDLSLGNSFIILFLCFLLFRGIIIMPTAGLSTLPVINIESKDFFTISPLIAKPTPAFSEILEIINALIPTISPFIFMRGPPEFPLLIAESV